MVMQLVVWLLSIICSTQVNSLLRWIAVTGACELVAAELYQLRINIALWVLHNRVLILHSDRILTAIGYVLPPWDFI